MVEVKMSRLGFCVGDLVRFNHAAMRHGLVPSGVELGKTYQVAGVDGNQVTVEADGDRFDVSDIAVRPSW